MRLSSQDTIRLKNTISAMNLALGMIALIAHDELSSTTFLGILIVGLGPVVWNQWLYGELFVDPCGKARITHRTFELFGLIGAIGVFSVITHSLIT